MNIELAGKTHQVSEGADGFGLFEDRSIIALRVNGELRDLSYKLREGDSVEGVDIASDDGLAILRHSTAHVMAQAVQEIFDPAKLGIGPPIKDGFYFDFETEAPGPILNTQEEVVAALQNLGEIERNYQKKYRNWQLKFDGHEDGKAASRVIAKVFSEGK